MPTQNFIVGELINKRTPNSKTWINFDGSYTTEIFNGAIHYEDENGVLQNVNTDLYDEADFDIIDEPISIASVEGFNNSRTVAKSAKSKNIMNRSNYNFKGLRLPFDVTIPRNFKRGYNIGKGANKLTFKPINASPSISELYENDRSRIIYQDVWNDTDVELKIQPTGIKETLFLKTEKAPTSFSFEVDGELEDDLSSGEMKLEAAWLKDSNGTYRDVAQTVRREDDKTFIDLTIDSTGLIYPIEVDPTVTISSANGWEDTWADAYNADTTWGNSTTVSVNGYEQWPSRPYIKFDISLPGNAAITKAELIFRAEKGMYYNAEAMNIAVHRVTGSWSQSTLTWNNQPSFTDTNKSIKTVSGEDVITLDVKNIVQDWVNGQPNYGVVVKDDTEKGTVYTGGAKIFYSSEHSNTEYRPSVQITYNNPPTTPIVVSPNGGEKWNALHTISWNQSTDVDGNPLTYEIQFTVDNGSTWKTIKTGVTGGSTTYDFINEPDTSLAKIRIRAFDGISYSPWDESNGVFTIDHNYAPTTPTNLSPSGGQPVNRANAVRLSWQHNDVNNNDPQSKFNLQWRIQGTTTWNEVTQTTINQYYDISNLPHGIIEWQVRTYDQVGLISPYSQIAVFIAGDKPSTPTITAPSEDVVPIPQPVVQWSSVEQVAFHLKVLDINGNLVWESQQISTNKALTLGIALTNETDYKIQVAIKNADNLWSEFITKQIYVTYTPPKKPIVTIQAATSHIVLDIVNPLPEGTEPEVTGNDIYKLMDGVWVRIAEGVTFEYRDYAVKSDVEYTYQVRAIGSTGAYMTSDVLRAAANFKGLWLHDIADAESTIYEFERITRRTSVWEVDHEKMKFEGRKYQVIETGEGESDSVSFDVKLASELDHYALERIVKSRSIVCYRDGNGRLLFGMFTKYPITDDYYSSSVSLELTRIDYTEKI